MSHPWIGVALLGEVVLLLGLIRFFVVRSRRSERKPQRQAALSWLISIAAFAAALYGLVHCDRVSNILYPIACLTMLLYLMKALTAPG